MLEYVDGAEVLGGAVAELEAKEVARIGGRGAAELDRERRAEVGCS